MQSNNVFSDLGEKISTFRKSRQKTAGGQVLDALEAEKNNAAQMWLIFGFLLLIASAITVYLNYKYYRFTFDPSYPDASFLLSVSLGALVEVGKVYLTYAVLSGIIFGWAFSGWFKLGGYVFAGVLAAGTYYWSYTTSTEGVQIYAQETSAVSLAQTPLSGQIKAATADIDAQIAAISGSNTDAAGMKTKKGKINWYGQMAMSNNSATLLSLQEQRKTVVNQVTADYQTAGNHIATKVDALSDWVMKFGGYAEYAVFCCLLAMIFFDKNSNDELMGTDAAKKVAEKVRTHNAKLSAQELTEELTKAASMNGSYSKEPLGKP